jgi:hypothetical protein
VSLILQVQATEPFYAVTGCSEINDPGHSKITVLKKKAKY